MEETLVRRVMPHSQEAEQSVIGAMIIDQEAIAVAMELLTGEDFYQKQYGTLFEAMTGLYSEGRPVDLVTLQNRLREMDVPVRTEFGKLSRGNKMKLGIAAAMSHGARLLILDEATSGLDPVVRDQVVDMIADFTREEDHAVLLSSHIVSDLEKVCDYIAFLHKGKLLLFEEKDELLSGYGIWQGSKEQLDEFDESAVVHAKVGAYGVRALVRKELLPAGTMTDPVGIEELFAQMVKEM